LICSLKLICDEERTSTSTQHCFTGSERNKETKTEDKEGKREGNEERRKKKEIL
jgi:hypothetical protein